MANFLTVMVSGFAAQAEGSTGRYVALAFLLTALALLTAQGVREWRAERAGQHDDDLWL
jgi:hypothetical protein